MSFSEDELERYSRQIVLEDIGYESMFKIRNAKVCVVGVGGLGNHMVVQLAAMGFGTIRIVDRDIVDLSNLHRQPLYDTKSLGYSKVEAAKKRLNEINPGVRVEALPSSVDYTTAPRIVKDMNVVLDGLDSAEARYALNDACVRASVPYVYGSAIESMGSVYTVLPKKVACFRCIFPSLTDDELPKCGTVGVHPSVLSLVAAIEVAEAVRIIAGKQPVLAGKLMMIDLNDLSFDKIDVARHEGCSSCGSKVPPALQTATKFVVDLCGRERGKRVFSITPAEDLALTLDKEYPKITSKYLVEKKGELGLTISYDNDTKISLLSSGVAIVTTNMSQAESTEAYLSIVEGLLGVNPVKVRGERIQTELA